MVVWLHSQVLGEVNPSGLLGPLTDHGGNTIVHQIAAAGNTEMFKVKCSYGLSQTKFAKADCIVSKEEML